MCGCMLDVMLCVIVCVCISIYIYMCVYCLALWGLGGKGPDLIAGDVLPYRRKEGGKEGRKSGYLIDYRITVV